MADPSHDGAPGPAPPHASLHLLAVGLEPGPLTSLSRWIDELDVQLESAPDLPRAIRRLAAGSWDVVMAVLSDEAPDDLEWWSDALRAVASRPYLIALAAHPSMDLILRAEKLGNLEVLTLPLRREALVRALSQRRAAASEVAVELPAADRHEVGPYALVGQSPAMLDVYKTIARVGRSAATVLIHGESGTGKEVVARALHLNGNNAQGPFVAVNCAAIPENLLESELFGHEKGAFTGAVVRKIGRFEQARGGTLFLDEISEMSMTLQAKILRAVQEREIERLGGNETIRVEVRVVAATNRDPREIVATGKLREDLYFRLAVVTIRMPPLAERGDDVPLLIAYFVEQFSRQYGKAVHRITDEALDRLRSRRWVGNVRELRNVVERAIILADGDVLRVEHLPEDMQGGGAETPSAGSDVPTLAQLEERHIARVLARTGGQLGAAAGLLGIHRNTLARKVREYGL